MKYRLLVLDLDGTLTNSEKEMTSRNRETLLKAQQQGIRLVLASGRPTYGIAPLADELRMDLFGGFVLSYNGGEIIDWKTKEMLYAHVLPDDIIPQLYACACQHGLAILSYDGSNVVSEHPDNEYVRKEACLNKMHIRACKDFLSGIHLPLAKCLIVGDPDSLIEVEAELSARMQGTINVYRSEPYFLELVPPGIDKAQSLAVLLERLGLQREEMVAIGDGYNDIGMIRFAGLGIAMANAQMPVKEAAGHVVPSNDEDGVAVAVEKYILTSGQPT